MQQIEHFGILFFFGDFHGITDRMCLTMIYVENRLFYFNFVQFGNDALLVAQLNILVYLFEGNKSAFATRQLVCKLAGNLRQSILCLFWYQRALEPSSGQFGSSSFHLRYIRKIFAFS